MDHDGRDRHANERYYARDGDDDAPAASAVAGSSDLATLDHLSDGRVMLGAGLGAEPLYTAFGESWEPKRLDQKYDEALDVITGLWRDEPFSYDGDHFTVDDAVVLPKPVQEPRIPIVLDGWWPNKKPFARAAEYDGIMPNWPSLFRRGDHATREVSGTPGAEVREMMELYHTVADDTGEIVLPIDPVGASTQYVETCREVGATWLLTTHAGAIYSAEEAETDTSGFCLEGRIRQGPPE